MFFTVEKFQNRTKELEQKRYHSRVSVFPFEGEPGTLPPDEVYSAPGPLTQGAGYAQNEFFEGRDNYLWLHKQVTLPLAPEGCEVVGLFDFGQTGGGFNSGFEALLYVNGVPYQGVDTYHEEVVFTGLAGQTVQLAFLLWTGLEGGGKPRNHWHQLKVADIGLLHKNTDSLYHYAKAITQTVQLLPDDNTDRVVLMKALEAALLRLDWDENTFYASADAALEILEARLEKAEKRRDIEVSVVGHTHIDMAWLWRIKHTREKAQRSFSTVLHLMEQYPEFVFLQSQPQLYKFLQQDNPGLFEKIKKRVQSGQWEVDGGMWVEADCNIPSGEALVRQFLYGMRYIQREFGHTCEYLWLPDVFGYSWALPQILQQFGIKTFMTTKISWSQYNGMPHDILHWRGIDGSEVLTYFINTPSEGQDSSTRYATYNGFVTPHALLGSWSKFKDKEVSQKTLISYGYGDGGGGVTREMLELRRKTDALPGLPAVKATTAGEFFRELHQQVAETESYVHTWDGELYLEYHRGTYTSQAYNKMMNRRMEYALIGAEALSVLAMVRGAHPYEGAALATQWKSILLQQFHDIIPGSSIHEVYADSRRAYSEAEAEVRRIAGTCATALCTGDENAFTLFSTATLGGLTQVFVPENREGSFYLEGARLEAQKVEGGHMVCLALPAFALTTLHFVQEEQPVQAGTAQVVANGVETPYYTIEWDASGALSRIYDKENRREILAAGGLGNVLEVFEDKPILYDAWDMDIFYTQKRETMQAECPPVLTENGPLQAVVSFRYVYRNSVLTQNMVLYSHSRRIDFNTTVDWHETHRLLKTVFYTGLRSTKAKYDIQFGHVERPTHWNTSWDWARFEVCAHKWADLSENDYGVSLLNNSKYGYSIKDGVMGLSLLKSAKYPDYEADMGTHSFTYSLLPHAGTLVQANTIEEADKLNLPPVVFPKVSAAALPPLLHINSSAVQVDAVKKAEDSQDIIVRLHECRGTRPEFTVELGFEPKAVVQCTLDEKEIAPLPYHNGVELKARPFEIITLKIRV